MRTSTLAALALVAACKSSQNAPPPAPPAPPAVNPSPAPTPGAAAPAGDAGTPAAAPTAGDAGTPAAQAPKHASEWKPPLTADEDKALDKYVGFSDDGYAFAFGELSKGAGVTVLTFYAVPTGTVEKRLVLDSPAARLKAAEELSADGFPKPGAPAKTPAGFDTQIVDDKVQVRVAGQPAGTPFKPFPAGKPAKAEVLALTPDGKTVAVHVTATNGAGEFGPMSEVKFQKLFE